MKILFTAITNGLFNKFRILLLLALQSISISFGFQVETPGSIEQKSVDYFSWLEAGEINDIKAPAAFSLLSSGHYEEALRSLEWETEEQYPWLRTYLESLVRVFTPLVKRESENFIIFTPAGQEFLAVFGLDALEKMSDEVEAKFVHRPKEKIRVEIYPNKEDFSSASTLSVETLERSGAIGICKFHRLMIVSPKALPLGYRWMDALAHEYMHLIINEMTHSKAELWFHEGTARYFETMYRLNPPQFLTPHQKTKLLEALEQNRLIPFEKMSPSMVYLKNQEEVSLAFAEVSYAIEQLVDEKKQKKFNAFLVSLRHQPFASAFRDTFGMELKEFEKRWGDRLSAEGWDKAHGTMSDEIRFEKPDEYEGVGADVQGRLRIADRMRRQGHLGAALLEYEKALKEEPDNALALLKAAKTHLSLGQTDAAVQKLERAIEKNPHYVTPYVELADLVEKERAIHCLLEANAINPFDPRIHQKLEMLYSESGQQKNAQREGGIYRLLMNNSR